MPGSYVSRFQEICIGHNSCTGPIRSTRANVTPIKGPILNNDRKLHCRR